jgi:hypothetical protein
VTAVRTKLIGGFGAAALIAVAAVASPASAVNVEVHNQARALTAEQVANRFLMVAYTYKPAFYYHGEKYNLGKRDLRYSGSTLDKILKEVGTGPDSSANSTITKPKNGRDVKKTADGRGIYSVSLRLPIVRTSTENQHSVTYEIHTYVNLKRIDGVWKTVGAKLPGAYGPTKYCKSPSEASTYCEIFPPGSRR